jgi:glucose/arabinose dehydrogenase
VAEQVLLRIDKAYNNHNGGDLAFGPDGYLYLSVGDGGGSGDPGNHAQNPARLLGKILRLDVTGTAGGGAYGIPADNPWAGNPRCGPGANAAACPEIFAQGLRNPWRLAFDAGTGALWAGDVGQNAREEINVVVRGGNYGWRCREGTSTYNTSGCPTGGFAAPVHDYPHADGNGSVTGGFVYRGAALPGLAGRYLFADYLSGRIWSLRETTSGYVADEIVDTALGVAALGPSLAGEPYLVDHAGGRL